MNLTQEKRICKDFINGSCKFKFCKFIHNSEPTINPLDLHNGFNDVLALSLPITKDNTINKSKSLCKLFLNGYCPYGSNCIFSHNNETTNNEKDFNRTERICHYFKNGNCSFGTKCKFLHPKIHTTTKAVNSSFDTNEKILDKKDINKVIYIGNIKAKITTGFTLTKLLLDTNNRTHLSLTNPYFVNFGKTKKIINEHFNIKTSHIINDGQNIRLYFDTPEDLDHSELVLKTVGICSSHNKLNCESMNCVISTCLNKLIVTRITKTYFNEILVTPNNYPSKITVNSIVHNLEIIGITQYKCIKELYQGTRNNKYIIKFLHDSDAEKLLLIPSTVPESTLSINNDIFIP